MKPETKAGATGQAYRQKKLEEAAAYASQKIKSLYGIKENPKMEERKKAAYEYLSKCLFSASEYLREAADTIDLEGLNVWNGDALPKFQAEIERMAQRAQKIAKESDK